MTPPTQDDLAAGRELDALVAEKVLGMRVERVCPPWYQGGRIEVLCFYAPGFDHMEYSYDANSCNAMMYRNGRDSSDGTAPSLPYYSDDIASAWTVLDEMVWRVGTANIRLDMEDYGRGAGTNGRAERAVWVTIGEHTAFGPAPLAICKAALAAVSG